MLLREVAHRLMSCVREGDTVARLGGDEFVVVLEDADAKEKEAATLVEAIAGKILVALSQTFQLGNIAYSSSGSIGLTMFKGMAGTAEELLKQADLAMYKSKENGRNACRFFDPYMEATVRKRAEMEADMQLAIVGNEFRLHYQPQVGADGRIEGAEALIRWNHPQRGMVMPGEFIPLAEETGLILPLGQWVLETACEQLAIWAGNPETACLKLSVNVSPRQFQQPDFVQQLLSTLKRTGADPYRLELELTESLLVDNVDEIIEEMSILQTRGVGFSLDDFGTGYSSLYYLKRMPLNQLKIDRSFVRDVMEDPNDAAIAKTIVALAHALGLGVIAEGVETAQQRDFLFDAGCDSYQGYFFSRPLSLEEYEQFVRLPVEQ
jgi:predicted signal transduction protein with EAL and GGDEF domain